MRKIPLGHQAQRARKSPSMKKGRALDRLQRLRDNKIGQACLHSRGKWTEEKLKPNFFSTLGSDYLANFRGPPACC